MLFFSNDEVAPFVRECSIGSSQCCRNVGIVDPDLAIEAFKSGRKDRAGVKVDGGFAPESKDEFVPELLRASPERRDHGRIDVVLENWSDLHGQRPFEVGG